MSSNHVYTTLVDKHGYLWISTSEGVYRYNGYTLRKYDYKDGLTNIDVWDMYEDAQNRIWLLNISNQLGFIKNGHYKTIHKNASDSISQIYCINIVEYADKILFINNIRAKANHTSIGIIKNDTLFVKNIPDMSGNFYPDVVINLGSIVLDISNQNIKIIACEKWMENDVSNAQLIHSSTNLHKATQNCYTYGQYANKYVYYLDRTNRNLNFYDYKKDTLYRLLPDSGFLLGEKILHCYPRGNSFYCITTKKVHIIDTLLRTKKIHNIPSTYPITSIDEENITFFNSSYFWGNSLSTKYNGLYINYPKSSNFTKSAVDLSNYRLVGKFNDSTGYWWNNNSKSLLQITSNKIAKTYYLPNIHGVKKIVRYNQDKSLILSENINNHWLNTNGIVDVKDGIDTVVYRNQSVSLKDSGQLSILHGLLSYIKDGVFTDDKQLYYIGAGYNGINKATFSFDKGKLIIDSVYFDKYASISYNETLKTVICYSGDKMLIMNIGTGKKIFVTQNALQACDIYGIQKILLDDFGNIFIKDYNKLVVFNPNTKKIRRLFSNYQLENAIMSLNNNILSMAGVFGIVQCQIYGPGKMSIVKVFPNTKKIYYSFISNAQFSDNNVLLNTDKGTYIVNTKEKYTRESEKHKIILSNDSILYDLQQNDTLTISQTNSLLGIDVVKPDGTGILNIQYSINNSEYINTGYSIIFPKIVAGSYNTISVIASDESWKSEPMTFVVYIKPYLWQTTGAKRIIFTLSLLLILGIIYLAIVFTKKVVNRNNDRRNQRRELELKSIYSQINPHFIFNSLSTALYFVKKNKTKEAYEHINQFSDLLRSYIKSSRNKYITITEELVNLENYLQLQLTRFEAKFEYIFNIDDSVNPRQLKIPSLLLQPLVENALNHGIFHSTEKGLLIISFKYNSSNDLLTCIIDDNGIGRKKSKEIRSDIIKKADSYGTILIKELIDTFNKYEKINIELEYIDKVEPQTGTIVVISIKNITHAQ